MTGSSTGCARCGGPEPTRTVYPPREWVEYLHAERDLDRFEGVLSVPLCGACHDRVSPLREAFRGIDDLSEERRDAVLERIERLLGTLELEALDTHGDDTGRHEGHRSDGAG